MHLHRVLLLAFSCTACSVPARPKVAPEPQPAMAEHVRERRSLGLDAGVVARRLFSASYSEIGPDGPRSERLSPPASEGPRIAEIAGDRSPLARGVWQRPPLSASALIEIHIVAVVQGDSGGAWSSEATRSGRSPEPSVLASRAHVRARGDSTAPGGSAGPKEAAGGFLGGAGGVE